MQKSTMKQLIDRLKVIEGRTNASRSSRSLFEDEAEGFDMLLYHGGQNLIQQFVIPPYGVYFSPHKDWAMHYGDFVTSAKVKANKIYKIDYSHKIDEDLMDALFRKDYQTVAEFIKILTAKGYQAMQAVSDSEMVVVFPGTPIEVVKQ